MPILLSWAWSLIAPYALWIGGAVLGLLAWWGKGKLGERKGRVAERQAIDRQFGEAMQEVREKYQEIDRQTAKKKQEARNADVLDSLNRPDSRP